MNSKQQLMDSLTSLISLYHSSSQSPPTNPNPNHRSSILKWFSSLTVHQRQSHLAIVDSNFVQVLLEMNSKIRSKGHGLFIVLPDMPSIDRPSLPSVCYRRSHGLLARVSESNESERLIYDSVKMFSSKEGDKIGECSDCSVNCLDSATVSESFVESVEKFVNVMDGVSNGGFLRGEGNELGDEWVELEWLKAKGYYGIEAFVANRLEVALRLSWLNCKNGKKRGVKLKEKASLAGVAANVYWRKKGCLDWWGKLDAATKQKVFQTVLGKAAKSLTTDVLKAKSNAVEEDDFLLFRTGTDNRSRFDYTISRPRTVAALRGGSDAEFGSVSSASVSGKATSLEYIFNSLLVLKDISTMLIACDDHNSESAKEKLFFSSLGSVNTVSNCILRKLRGLLMVVSLDCTKLELLEEVVSWNGPTKKSEEKPGACSRRKKGKARNSKRVTADLISASSDPKLDEPAKVDGFELTYIENNRLASAIQEKDLDSETSLSALNMEHGEGLVNGNVHARKNKKRRNKHKNSCLTGDAEVEVSQRKTKKISAFSGTSKHTPIDASTGEDKKVLNQLQTTQDKKVACTCEASSQTGMESNQLSDEVRRNHFIGSETINYTVASATPPVMPVVERYIVPKSVSPGEGSKSFDSVEITQIQGQDGNSSHSTGAIVSAGCPPYEWPSVAPFHFPSISPHIPAATDRLHLDVGHNWKNHFHPPLLPTVHQVRNQPIENGILSRPMSMSLDWPPMVRSFSGLVPSMTYSYDSGFISRTQPSFQRSKEERMYTGDNVDLSDPTTSQEITDDHENHWISEEEIEVHTVSGMDYSQYFGGGVMYWNPSDRNGTGFSRPPSLSSDDSSWAWREADMNTTVDDMVAFSSSYSTNGLTSPSAASFCSPFDPMGPTHQALGYVIPGSEVTSNNASGPEENASASLLNLPGCEGEAKTGDSLQYPILRPIIIPSISRERSRSEFKRSHDHKSPCVRIKRPPSPVVLCVPNAPRPPPPSPVGDRKHRGFPTVRSGSSSPRHWGVRGWFHDGINFEESCMRMDGSEVVWPSWRNKSLAARQLTQPLPGALLQDRLIAISQLARDQEHPDVAFPLQPPESLNNSTRKASLAIMHSLLHDEIDSFYKQVTAENMVNKPYFSWAVKRVTRSLQVLWPRSRTNIFGSNATGLSLPTSDVDLVVCLPPVRNLEPIKEAGILEGRNGIKETCLQHAARYLANQEWVKSDSIKIVENTAIPIIMLVVEVPRDLVPAATVSHVQIPKEEPSLLSNEQDRSFLTDKDGSESSALPEHSVINNDKVHDTKSVRIDISFKSPSHTGLQTTELVKELTEQFPAATPLAMVLKQFLSDRSLDQSYSGGLSSYCLILMITRFLQHEHHHGRSINQNFGGLLMDFLYFFGNVFDPRQMRISVQGNGVYINRERGYSIDPIYIDDPLFPANNVGRNCFRIHQCIKAFADAYTALENELASFPSDGDSSNHSPCKLLPKIIPSIGLL